MPSFSRGQPVSRHGVEMPVKNPKGAHTQINTQKTALGDTLPEIPSPHPSEEGKKPDLVIIL